MRYDTMLALAGSPKSTTYVKDPVRGCGQKKPGGCYLEMDASPSGQLGKITWVLGTHIDESELDLMWSNVYTSASKRGFSIINPAATLATGQIVYRKDKQVLLTPVQNDLYQELVNRVGPLGILDRVGSDNYTPWSFAEEVWHYGPSRKVSSLFLETIAQFLPIPVFFCHGDMPIYGRGSSVAASSAAEMFLGASYGEYRYSPTWTDPDWGMGAQLKKDGSDHYLVPILYSLDETKNVNESLLPDAGKERLAKLRMLLTPPATAETVFLGSWFTRGTYVLKNESDPGLSMENVHNIVIDEDEEMKERIGVA